MNLKSDLGALAKILPPGMVQLKEDTDLAGKAAVIVKVKTRSVPKKGAASSMAVDFNVDAALTNLEAVETKTKKHSVIDPSITLKAKGAWDGGRNDVHLESLDLKSLFATADAKGGFVLTEPMSVRESLLTLKMDLAALGAKLGLFMADPPALTGSVEATASYAGDSNFLTSTGTLAQTITQDHTQLDLTSSANPSVSGQMIAFTVTVTIQSPGAGAGTPTNLSRTYQACISSMLATAIRPLGSRAGQVSGQVY